MKLCPQCGTEYDDEQRFCPRDGSTLRRRDAAADLVGQIVADRYHVIRKLGEGGMGQVYLAEHVKMGRRSALKVMHPAMGADADAISRFNREATNASRITHPNVCAIYDFGETPEGMIWLAMEYVDGEPLTALVERRGALPAPRAAEIARQAAEALDAAHELGIVHRDLKPDNIMVARGRDGADVVKVVDFGIAKAGNAESQKVTKTGLIVGTPEYMSPEQLAGDPVDARSDIYALGLVAFNMLTGALPFPSETVQEAMIMRLTERPRTLAETRAATRWPPALQTALDHALAREATARPATATAFARELVAAASAMPESALADVGTQVLASPGAVPATRVADASLPRVASATAPAAPGSRSRRRGALVAVALVSLLGAGGAAVVLRGDGGEAGDAAVGAAPTLALSGVADSIRVASPAGDSGAASATPAATADSAAARSLGRDRRSSFSSPAAVPPDTGSAAPAPQDEPASPPSRDVRAELRRMKRVVDDAMEGNPTEPATRAALREVFRESEPLLPRSASDTDIDRVDAAYVRAAAHGLLAGSSSETCAMLERIRGREGNLVRASEIAKLHAAFCS
ncbi:MAG TPA: protein kinase [Gemmatimonadaceae bacterium]